MKIKFIVILLFLFCCDSNNNEQQANSLNEGLIAYYPFSGNANDESENNLNGILYGAKLTTDRFEKHNSAFLFDGNDYIRIAHDSIFNAKNLTVAAWVYLDEYPPELHLSSIINNGTFLDEEAWELLIRDGGNSRNDVMVQFDYRGINGEDNRICSAGLSEPTLSMNLQEWYHLVGIYDANDEICSIYCNGLLIKAVPGCPGKIINNSNDIFIGFPCRNPAGNRHGFKGKIDELFIYNRPLSYEEILILYGE